MSGHGNRTARSISFRQDDGVNAKALTARLEQVIANCRAGGWEAEANLGRRDVPV
jgi:hypothetical protein